MTPVQQIPQGLWNGLFQDAQPLAPQGQSLLPLMLEKQKQQQDPRLYMREINPGVTWGGRDRNAIQPDDLMQMYFSPMTPENL